MNPKTPSSAKLPLFKRLGFRVVLTMVTLAVLPFSVSMVVLFHIAKADVREFMGESLAQEAALLAYQVEDEIERLSDWTQKLAVTLPVRRHLTKAAPFPEEFIATAQKLQPFALEVEIIPGAKLPAEELLHTVLGDDGSIQCSAPILQAGGKAVGAVVARFSPDMIFEQIARFRRDHKGLASLVTPTGILASSGPDPIQIPHHFLWGTSAWNTFVQGGEGYYLGKKVVGKSWGKASSRWRVMVVLRESDILEDFNFAATQASIMLVMLGIMVLALSWKTGNKILSPIKVLRSGAEIISKINLSHRIVVDTGDELEGLADDFNHMAESLQNSYGELEHRLEQVTKSLEGERNRLAILLRTMAEGLVAANENGEVLLMNPRARGVLKTGPHSGIGIKLESLLPRARLNFYLRRLRSAWDEGRQGVERVLFPLADSTVLTGIITPLPDPSGDRAGFLFVFRDVSADAVREKEAEKMLRNLPASLKGPMASIHSLTEILARRPDLDPKRRQSFLQGLAAEAERSVKVLEGLELTTPAIQFARWPIQPSDPRELLEEALAMEEGTFVKLTMPEEQAPHVAVEPFTWVAVMGAALKWTASKSDGLTPIETALEIEEDSVVVTFRLVTKGEIATAELYAIQISPEGEEPVNLETAVKNNRGEIWTRKTPEGFEVRLAMSKASVVSQYRDEPHIADDQVEFYDFDLFMGRPGKVTGAQLDAKLSELEFVVFDTETTGLNPSQGDRIVSISGVRVRGTKVLKADTFHALVNPGMKIPPISISIHKITDEMVTDAPIAGKVLPKFVEWVGDAVLVAHNAAFDIKMLEVETTRAAQPMVENQVLDTLFISYGVHGDHEGHNLEAMALRMGVEVEGRHTSLGDAKTTAQIFVRMLPLLAARGVHTLAEAKAFCDKNLILKWQSSRF